MWFNKKTTCTVKWRKTHHVVLRTNHMVQSIEALGTGRAVLCPGDFAGLFRAQKEQFCAPSVLIGCHGHQKD
jgi:hypothetical protein